MWPNLQETEDLVTFTEEILNGKLHFLCSVRCCIAALKTFGNFTDWKYEINLSVEAQVISNSEKSQTTWSYSTKKVFICKILRKTPAPESLFNKEIGGKGVFRWIYPEFLRTPFLQNVSWQLLLTFMTLTKIWHCHKDF